MGTLPRHIFDKKDSVLTMMKNAGGDSDTESDATTDEPQTSPKEDSSTSVVEKEVEKKKDVTNEVRKKKVPQAHNPYNKKIDGPVVAVASKGYAKGEIATPLPDKRLCCKSSPFGIRKAAKVQAV